jgi:hypothetical protein
MSTSVEKNDVESLEQVSVPDGSTSNGETDKVNATVDKTNEINRENTAAAEPTIFSKVCVDSLLFSINIIT